MVSMIQTDRNDHLDLITSMVSYKIREINSLRFDVSAWVDDNKAKFTLFNWDFI